MHLIVVVGRSSTEQELERRGLLEMLVPHRFWPSLKLPKC